MMPLEPRKVRIFVAEDDKAILDLITTRLAVAGYDYAFGRDGWEAVHGIMETRPAAILLDINMPGLNGFGVLKVMRETPSIANIPVMVLTARNAPEDVREALSLGARDFLAKPFDDAQLLTRIARLLRPRPAPAPSVLI